MAIAYYWEFVCNNLANSNNTWIIWTSCNYCIIIKVLQSNDIKRKKRPHKSYQDASKTWLSNYWNRSLFVYTPKKPYSFFNHSQRENPKQTVISLFLNRWEFQHGQELTMQKFNKEKPTFKRDLTANKLKTRWSKMVEHYRPCKQKTWKTWTYCVFEDYSCLLKLPAAAAKKLYKRLFYICSYSNFFSHDQLESRSEIPYKILHWHAEFLIHLHNVKKALMGKISVTYFPRKKTLCVCVCESVAFI